MYHIFFIHSSVDKHLGCFHVLAIVHSAVMNTEVYVFFFFFVRPHFHGLYFTVLKSKIKQAFALLLHGRFLSSLSLP